MPALFTFFLKNLGNSLFAIAEICTPKDSFGLISLYGLCCISTPTLILETKIVGKNPNYFEIKDNICSNQIKTEEEFQKIYPLLKKL